MRLHRVLIPGIAASLLLQVAAWAGAPTEQLRAAAEELVRILGDPSLKLESRAKEREARIRAAAADLFDYAETAMRALGRHWRSLGQSEREEFVQFFRALLEHSHLPKIALYQGERMRFTGESVAGDLASVQALVMIRKRKEVPVSYRLHRRDGRWLIYDISIEGLSLVGNYRSRFNEIIQRSSYQELINRIRQGTLDEPIPTRTEAP